MSRTHHQAAPVHTATATSEKIMRRRSSSRCCSKLIEPNSRCSFCSSGSATSSGIVVLRDVVLDAFGQTVQSAGERDVVCVIQDLVDFTDRRLEVLAGIRFFEFQLADFVMNLALEAVAGFAEFAHKPPYLAGDFGQPPRPKENEGQEHQENDLAREAEVHTTKSIILHNRADGPSVCVNAEGVKAFESKGKVSGFW